jgi:hypothetical protein
VRFVAACRAAATVPLRRAALAPAESPVAPAELAEKPAPQREPLPVVAGSPSSAVSQTLPERRMLSAHVQVPSLSARVAVRDVQVRLHRPRGSMWFG